MSKAEGVYFWDQNGNRYLELCWTSADAQEGVGPDRYPLSLERGGF